MTESPTLQADTPAKAERLAEIARMADLLADRLLNDQIMGNSVSMKGTVALLNASILLRDYGHPIPPMLSQVVQDLGGEGASEPFERRGEAEPDGAGRLAHSLRSFQGSYEPKG